jgi:hypothetical protein
MKKLMRRKMRRKMRRIHNLEKNISRIWLWRW